jgi:hypothetical protein
MPVRGSALRDTKLNPWHNGGLQKSGHAGGAVDQFLTCRSEVRLSTYTSTPPTLPHQLDRPGPAPAVTKQAGAADRIFSYGLRENTATRRIFVLRTKMWTTH